MVYTMDPADHFILPCFSVTCVISASLLIDNSATDDKLETVNGMAVVMILN